MYDSCSKVKVIYQLSRGKAWAYVAALALPAKPSITEYCIASFPVFLEAQQLVAFCQHQQSEPPTLKWLRHVLQRFQHRMTVLLMSAWDHADRPIYGTLPPELAEAWGHKANNIWRTIPSPMCRCWQSGSALGHLKKTKSPKVMYSCFCLGLLWMLLGGW